MTDLWSYLITVEKPIIMYGMGNGADRILSVCEEKGIRVSGFFASDGFVRGHSFHGMKVMSYCETCSNFDDFVVLLGFASDREEVMENIGRIAAERELYIPDVPVYGEYLFNSEFCEKHSSSLSAARELLGDEDSKTLFDNIVKFKLTGKPEYLTYNDNAVNSIIFPGKYSLAVDCGAYNGDTAAALLSVSPSIKKIICLEPDPRNYRRLCENTQADPRIEAINAAAADECGSLPFLASSGRGATVGKEGIAVPSITVDSLTRDRVDYIKYDVEGGEYKALFGSRKTIIRDRPDLCVSLYHRSEDIYKLPLYINSICPEYVMYLRRKNCIPAWELQLYCTAAAELKRQ